MQENPKHPTFRKIDGVVMKVFKYISYPPAVLMILIAVMATINVISSKLFHVIVPSVNDWITYLLIPIVFLSISHVQLDRGLVVVDVLNKHYPKWLIDTIDVISNLCLIALNGFISWRAFVLMGEKFAHKEISSIDAGHFYMWPFSFLLGFGMLCFAFTSFWCVLRTIFDVHPAPPVSPETAAVDALKEERKGGEDL
mgnify:CR=1 FL=1